jgi:N-acetylneuraminic acid mutarotase
MRISPRALAIGISVIPFAFAGAGPGSAQTPLVFAKLSSNLVRTPQPRQLSLADRVAYQYAIEEVYWRHRIWPRENARAKPPLDEVMSPTQVRQKVENYLRNSQLLAEQGQQPITAEQLQGEMERMAGDTKQPKVLDELFSALGNDPAIIAECLARQVLTERLVRGLSLRDERYVEQSVQGEEIAYPIAPELKKIAVHKFKKEGVPEVLDEVSGGYTLPRIAGSSSTCADDSWTATSTTNAPAERLSQTAVWTGTEMIVWGGFHEIPTEKLNTGSRYNPSTDSWVATTTNNAPDARDGHTAIWTGTEMIVWGGASSVYENTGGRYNPGTDSWVATTNANPPAGRAAHTAVWTGSEMIVWGGFFIDGDGIHHLHTGGRYDPSTDSWVGTSTTNVPVERQLHTAVWTGSEMIVWGGFSGVSYRNTGGRYNPITNSWVATTNANPPAGRATHTAVWTGSEMIVWGGTDASTQLNTGGKYNPSTDSWLATTITNAPDVRSSHTAVWTGSEMIAWGGGSNGSLNTGGRYDPSTDSWVATSTTDAPVARQIHTAVWTGSEMIVWGGGNSGGELNSGGRYCAPTGTLGNISTRMRVESGNNVLIGGFIITGSAPKNVAVRGIGPSLAQSGIPDALADPTLELRDSGGTLIRQNDNWQDDASQASQLTALGLALQNSNESGMVASLSPAAYTATLAGKNGGTGVGLVEIYDTGAGSNSQLANISTRGFVLTGSNVMIGGFILGGANNTHVAVRGIGPSLAQFGLSPVLDDPTLELRDSNGALLVSNDNWQDDPVSASQLTARGLAPANAAEAGIHVSLSPGTFTAIMAGKNGGTGIGLIEIYNVH